MKIALTTVSSSLCSGGCAPPLYLAVLIGFFAVRVTWLMLGRGRILNASLGSCHTLVLRCFIIFRGLLC